MFPVDFYCVNFRCESGPGCLTSLLDRCEFGGVNFEYATGPEDPARRARVKNARVNFGCGQKIFNSDVFVFCNPAQKKFLKLKNI